MRSDAMQILLLPRFFCSCSSSSSSSSVIVLTLQLCVFFFCLTSTTQLDVCTLSKKGQRSVFVHVINSCRVVG